MNQLHLEIEVQEIYNDPAPNDLGSGINSCIDEEAKKRCIEGLVLLHDHIEGQASKQLDSIFNLEQP